VGAAVGRGKHGTPRVTDEHRPAVPRKVIDEDVQVLDEGRHDQLFVRHSFGQAAAALIVRDHPLSIGQRAHDLQVLMVPSGSPVQPDHQLLILLPEDLVVERLSVEPDL
jgi:hypothetical protein